MKHFILVLAMLVLAASYIAVSQIPNKISYQGLLTTSTGTPVADGSYDLKFEIFNLPTAGTMRHSETQTGVSVLRGTFSVILGTAAPLTLAFDESLYVEVTAVSGPAGPTYPLTFSPRSELTSAPYALALPNVYVDPSLPFVGIGRNFRVTNREVFGIRATFGLGEFGGMYVETSEASGAPFYGYATNGAFKAYHYFDGGTNKWHLYNGGNERLTVQSNGNVGIGTTSPGAKLAVVGGIKVLTTDSGTDNGLRIYDATGGTYYGSLGYFGTRLKLQANDPYDVGVLNAAGSGITVKDVSGNVGIGTTSPAALLHVNGTAGNNTGVWSNVSDRRLKTNIEPIQSALETVKQLQGVTFRWKDSKKDAEFGRVRGLIAQDVERVIPEWIKTDPDGFKRIEPIGVDALLIEAIKQQQNEIDAQQKEIQDLKAMVKSLVEQNQAKENKSLGELK